MKDQQRVYNHVHVKCSSPYTTVVVGEISWNYYFNLDAINSTRRHITHIKIYSSRFVSLNIKTIIYYQILIHSPSLVFLVSYTILHVAWTIRLVYPSTYTTVNALYKILMQMVFNCLQCDDDNIVIIIRYIFIIPIRVLSVRVCKIWLYYSTAECVSSILYQSCICQHISVVDDYCLTSRHTL